MPFVLHLKEIYGSCMVYVDLVSIKDICSSDNLKKMYLLHLLFASWKYWSLVQKMVRSDLGGDYFSSIFY